MSTWRHRVRRRPASWSETGFWFDIVEFFPNNWFDDDETESTEAGKWAGGGWTEDGMTPGGKSIESLRKSLEWMLKALDEPPIEDDSPYESA